MLNKSLTFTQAMHLYKKRARPLFAALPKGCKRKAGMVWRNFMEQEKEMLRNWYSGMQLQVLDAAAFKLLLKTRRKRLDFRKLKQQGINQDTLVHLKEALLDLLLRAAISCSGANSAYAQPRFKVRLYRLTPVNGPDMEWDGWDEWFNPHLLN